MVVPAHNAADTIEAAVQSAVAQGGGVEVIVVDDGSVDDTARQAARVGARLIRQENGGVASALNAGVRESTRRFVTFLDADDVLAEGSLAARRRAVSAAASPAVVGVPAGLLYEQHTGPVEPDVLASCPLELSLDFYRSGGFFPTAYWLMLVDRRRFRFRQPWFKPQLKVACDYEFYLSVLDRWTVPVVQVPTVFRRIHPRNLSVSIEGGYALRDRAVSEVRGVARTFGVALPERLVPWETRWHRTALERWFGR